MARPFVVRVSPDPDLVDDCEAMFRLPSAVYRPSHEESFPVTPPLDDPPLIRAASTLTLPPALKKCLIALALEKVADICVVNTPVQVALETGDCSAAEVVTAVVFGDPAATAEPGGHTQRQCHPTGLGCQRVQQCERLPHLLRR